MPDQATPHGTSINSLAVVIGSCRYSNDLAGELRKEGYPLRLYSLVPYRSDSVFINPFNVAANVTRFRKDGITHLMVAGTVDIKFLASALIANHGPGHRKRPTAKQMVEHPHSFYMAYETRLQKVGILTLAARDLIPSYSPHYGQMGTHTADDLILSLLPGLKAQAVTLCSSGRSVKVPQTVVYDDGEPVAVESQSTDELLANLKPKRPGKVRTLIKVQPNHFPTKINLPTIGPETIAAAATKGVDMIALDVTHGLIIDRDQTLRDADAASIAVFGI